MTSLINKIELLIKREKTTPERKKKEEASKSSSEILSELFGAFNADPPKIDEASLKKSKKSKKKHKKEKKKRSRSSSSSDSDDSDYSHKRKKRKKSKSKKKRDHSRSGTPSKIKADLETIRVKNETGRVKSEDTKEEIKPKIEPKEVPQKKVPIKVEEPQSYGVDVNNIDASLIPMPDSPKQEVDLRLKLDNKKQEVDSDKSKSKIQIKNLKFSAVFEETVKKAEEEARKKAEKYEEGEYTDSSTNSEKPEVPNAEFPKSSDPGGILKKQAAVEVKVPDEEPVVKKTKESSHKSSKRRDRSKSRKRSSSKSRRSRSTSRRRRRSVSRSRRSTSRSRRSVSRSRRSSRSRQSERTRRRSRSRSRHRPRHVSPRHRDVRGRRSRSPTGVKLADSEKKRLLEVARRNAINMLKNGAVPAGAAALPPHTRNQVMAAIQSGGKSVDELTDFCKHLSKKEALGELSSVSSHEDGMSENEDTLAFHHPFLVKEKAPIVMNIRGGAPLPIKTNPLPIANKEELRLQFPVSSGSQHRDNATEWVPVSPPKKDMQVAKLNSKSTAAKSTTSVPTTVETTKAAPLALPAPPASTTPPYLKSFTTSTQLATVPALPAPGPQAYPPGIDPVKMLDVASIVSQKLLMIRKEQEQNELTSTSGSFSSQFGWSANRSLGQFTGSTGAQILTPKELASGTQAWAKKVPSILLCENMLRAFLPSLTTTSTNGMS